MAFRDFPAIPAVQKQYSIVYREEPFIIPVPLAPSQAFLDDHRFRITYLDVLASEASRCENIIYPVLFEAYKHHADALSLWSHTAIAYDDVLAGVPDYIVSARSRLGKTFLETPLLIVAEAKSSDFGQGWGQCLAALVAAQRLNGDETLPVYGIVTDGLLWQFGRLVRDVFTAHQPNIKIDELDELFSAINYLLQQAAQSIPVRT